MDFDIVSQECSLHDIHVISPDFGGSSRFGAFLHGLTLGRRNLQTRVFAMSFFSDRISEHLSFTAVSTWRINCLQLKGVCMTFIDLIDGH